MTPREARNAGACDAAADEAAVRAFPLQMIEAWNAGDGAAFAAPFSDTADFIAFEGTHLKGRRAIAEFHQRLFDTELAGPRLAGHTKPTPSRESMQIFVALKRSSEWRVESLLNARKLTLEQQFFADDFARARGWSSLSATSSRVRRFEGSRASFCHAFIPK